MKKSYTAQVDDDGFALVRLKLRKCATCGKRMASMGVHYDEPPWLVDRVSSQLNRAGVVEMSGDYVQSENDGPARICVECSNAGRGVAVCYICKERRQQDEMKDSYGDPPEHLCKPCFATVPAKEWEAAVDHLSETHRYDFD